MCRLFLLFNGFGSSGTNDWSFLGTVPEMLFPEHFDRKEAQEVHQGVQKRPVGSHMKNLGHYVLKPDGTN